MSKTIKVRKPRQPRSEVTMDMILNCKGGPHKDRREKRRNNPRNRWENDHGF